MCTPQLAMMAVGNAIQTSANQGAYRAQNAAALGGIQQQQQISNQASQDAQAIIPTIQANNNPAVLNNLASTYAAQGRTDLANAMKRVGATKNADVSGKVSKRFTTDNAKSLAKTMQHGADLAGQYGLKDAINRIRTNEALARGGLATQLSGLSQQAAADRGITGLQVGANGIPNPTMSLLGNMMSAYAMGGGKLPNLSFGSSTPAPQYSNDLSPWQNPNVGSQPVASPWG